MKEELKLVQEDIKDLKERLRIAEEKEKRIKEKIGAPDLVGKYIHVKGDFRDSYLIVKKVNFSDLLQCYTLEGPCISIDILAIGMHYSLTNRCLVSANKPYEIITEDEYNKVREKAFKEF